MALFRKINTEKYVGGRGTNTGVTRAEKRKGGRIRCSTLDSSLGPVLDLSPTGLRLLSKSQPKQQVGDQLDLTLKADGEELDVKARCVWIRVNDDRKFEMGFEFVGADGALKKRLIDMAATGQACEGLTRGWSPMQWWNQAG